MRSDDKKSGVSSTPGLVFIEFVFLGRSEQLRFVLLDTRFPWHA
jgi:hypothetical protein